VNEVWVANASPIIVLAKCGYLDLLSKLSREVLIPPAVVDEIVAGPPADPARQFVENGWGARAIPRLVALELLEWGLGPGETSVLALAVECAPAIAVLDDAAARTCAKAIGMPVIGSLGVILRAKKHGLLPSAADAMKLLCDAGLYLDNETVRSALQHVGENWRPE
jgi:predicted nucleic acid-binding protein